MPVCMQTYEKNISVISTAMIKENHKCNGLQRIGQWPRPRSEAVCTKLVRSELNCLKTAPSLQRWFFKGLQTQGLWVPAPHQRWQGARPQSCSCSYAHLWPGKLQALGNFEPSVCCKALTSQVGELGPNGRKKKYSPKKRNGLKKSCLPVHHLSQ